MSNDVFSQTVRSYRARVDCVHCAAESIARAEARKTVHVPGVLCHWVLTTKQVLNCTSIITTKIYRADLTHCQKAGCFAAMPVPGSLRRAMQKNRKARIIMRTYTGEIMRVPLSLRDFSQAYARLKGADANGQGGNEESPHASHCETRGSGSKQSGGIVQDVMRFLAPLTGARNDTTVAMCFTITTYRLLSFRLSHRRGRNLVAPVLRFLHSPGSVSGVGRDDTKGSRNAARDTLSFRQRRKPLEKSQNPDISAKSVQSGLYEAIRASFFDRRHFLICFSR